jgi:secreted PhoX family phosphatase
MTETDDDHAAETFDWELFLVCGEPEDESTHFAGYPKDEVTAISCPDNLAFDHHGNLWIATDGQDKSIGINDGMFAVPVAGKERGKVRQFMSTVTGSEVAGPEFTPDNTTLFLAIQHPGEKSTYDEPSTSWPGESGPPRPSVIAITAKDGSAISD